MRTKSREELLSRRGALEDLALEYAIGPKPSGDGAWEAFDAECRGIENEITAIDAELRRRAAGGTP